MPAFRETKSKGQSVVMVEDQSGIKWRQISERFRRIARILAYLMTVFPECTKVVSLIEHMLGSDGIWKGKLIYVILWIHRRTIIELAHESQEMVLARIKLVAEFQLLI